MHSGSFYWGLDSIFLTEISSSCSSSNLFFKEMLIPGPPIKCHEILTRSGFSIICSNYISIWWWSWSFCIPQWPMQPSVTHHRLISHVHCSLKKTINVLFRWRKRKEKWISPVHPSQSMFPLSHWCQFCASTKNSEETLKIQLQQFM